MPRFAANLSTMFREHDWLARPMAARRAGFDAVEIQSPYDIDLDALVRAKNEAGVESSSACANSCARMILATPPLNPPIR